MQTYAILQTTVFEPTNTWIMNEDSSLDFFFIILVWWEIKSDLCYGYA